MNGERRAAAEALVERTVVSSGVPHSVSDPVVLARVARLVVQRGADEPKSKPEARRERVERPAT